jgi:hypothetical protein
MSSQKQEWREKAEGSLEDIDYLHSNKRFKLRHWYRLFWAIGAVLVSISYNE